MKSMKRIFTFLLSLCCVMTTVMNSSLTNVSAATQITVTIAGNGGCFDVTGTGASKTGTGFLVHVETLDDETTLKDSNIVISNPVATTDNPSWIFNCWEVFDNTNTNNPVRIDGGLTTQQMLEYDLPSHDVLFRAAGNGTTGGGNSGGNQGTNGSEVMFYADGGDFPFTDQSGMNGRTGWSNFWVTSGSSLGADGFVIGDAFKNGYIFKGWMECTYTVDPTTNMPICIPITGATLMSSTDVMKYTIPTNGTAFIAQYDVDTRTYVSVFFNGNEGTFAFTNNGFTQNNCEVWGNQFPVGSTVAKENPNLTINNPVFWNSNRAFEGWMACEKVWTTNPDGSRWESLEQISGTSIMTTSQALAYTIPDKDLYFMAKYAGDDSDYYSMVRINGYGAHFTYDEIWYDMNNQPQTNSRTQEGWGSQLRIDGTTIEDQTKTYFQLTAEPTKANATFEGWIEFKIETKKNVLGNDYEAYTLVNKTIYTTAQMLALKVPSYDVVYVAKWSDMDYDDYYTWVNKAEAGFNAEPGQYYFENPLYNIKPGYYMGSSYLYEVGTTMASNNVVVKDPTAPGYIFKGWKLCTVAPSPNGPVYTPVPNTTLFTTTDALNYQIPDYAIRFVAEWEQDARPYVNVSFDANDGEMTVVHPGNSMNTNYYGGEFLVGSKVSDTNLVVKDPVFWDSNRAFKGWEVNQRIETTDVEGNPHIILKPIAGTGILTTVQALDFEIPNCDIVFMAQYAGNDEDYYSQVYINGYGHSFEFEETRWNNGQQVSQTIQTQVWGNYLREDGTSLADQTKNYFAFKSEPTKPNATFEGWLEFEVTTTQNPNGMWEEKYTLVSDTLYTSAQMLAKPIPTYDVAYVAKWSDIPAKEYFADTTAIFLQANEDRDAKVKAEITLKVPDTNGQQIEIKTLASECHYLDCYTVAEGLATAGWEYVGISKQCAKLAGWKIYSFDSYSFEKVPAGQDLNVGDPDVTFVYFDTYTDDNNNTYDRYLGMVNARMEFGYASTSQLMNFKGFRNYHYAVAVWEDAHTEAPFVQENVVKPVENADGTYTPGSYDKVVYCATCQKELSREACAITIEVQSVTVPGIEAECQLEVRSAITEEEIPTELKNKGFDTVAEISEALEAKALESVTSLDEDKIQVEEVWLELKVWDEVNNTWAPLTAANMPAEGVEVVLPYPAGMNSSNCTIVVTHMFDEGPKAGEIEVLTPTFKADGIHVTITECSPFSIVYQEKEVTPNYPPYNSGDNIVVTSPKTGDTMSMTAIFAVVALLSVVVVFVSRKETFIR